MDNRNGFVSLGAKGYMETGEQSESEEYEWPTNSELFNVGQGWVSEDWEELAEDFHSDRDRGFLTDSDREYLLWKRLDGHAERKRRLHIRDRIKDTYLDFRYLRYLSRDDHKTVFKNLGKPDAKFRTALKEFVRFSQLGALHLGANLEPIVEWGIAEAETDYAVSQGKYVDVDVDINIEPKTELSAADLKERFEAREDLSEDQLEALIIGSDQIDIVDVLSYLARKKNRRPSRYHDIPHHNYSIGRPERKWSDSPESYNSGTIEPDRERFTEAKDDLRGLLEDHQLTTLTEVRTELEHSEDISDFSEYNSELATLIDKLVKTAPYFKEDLHGSRLSESDSQVLHDIVWDPEDKPVGAIRPPTADENWTPAEDVHVQKFVARVEVAREIGMFHDFVEWNPGDRWEEFKNLVDYNPDKWTEYKKRQRAEHCEALFEDMIDYSDALTFDLARTFLREAKEWDASLRENNEDPYRGFCTQFGLSHDSLGYYPAFFDLIHADEMYITTTSDHQFTDDFLQADDVHVTKRHDHQFNNLVQAFGGEFVLEVIENLVEDNV